MTKWIVLLVCCIAGLHLYSQKPAITWGDNFKLRKGSTDLEVIHADKSGVYLQEGHLALKTYFVIGATTRSSAKLIKLDKNLTQIFTNDFNRELKGKEFVQFFSLRNKLFIVASEYNKRENMFNIYAAEINKGSGELAGMWKQLTSIEKESKKTEINFKMSYNADSSEIVIVSSAEGSDKNAYRIQEFNETLKPSGKAITISNEFDPKTFQLEDVLYTTSKNIILVGRIYEYREGKKKKDKFLDFAHYNIRLYNNAGKQIKELNTAVNGRWLTSTRLMQENGKDLILAAFYSKDKKDKTIDGLLVQRINPVNGEVILTTDKKIDNSMLNTSPGEDDEKIEGETREERKERERLEKIKNEGEAFSTYMKFQKIYYSQDGGIILLAEKYRHYLVSAQRYSPGSNGMGGTWVTVTSSVYECEDLLMCKINADKSIAWLNILPKSQREVTAAGSSSFGSGFSFSSFFDPSNRPFYGGFGSMQANNSIFIFFNDNPKNAVVLKPGQKIKRTLNFSKSHCFTVCLDETTGKYTRRQFYSNSEIPTSMPRLYSIFDKNMYIVGKDDRLMGKSKIAVAKITLK